MTAEAGARVFVDAWDPAYGSTLEAAGDDEIGPAGQSSAALNVDVELPGAAWRPLAPPPGVRTPPTVLLVDGVRRLDARVWVQDPDGSLHPGLAASYAAGVVRCDLRAGQAEVAAAQVARGCYTPSAYAIDLAGPLARYPVHRVAAADPAQLTSAVQSDLHALESQVCEQARAGAAAVEDDLLVLDGPLRGHTQLPRALGHVKTHRVHYLPPELGAMIGALRPGQRTPVFLLGTTWHRYTWYLKLPTPRQPSGRPGSPWAGVVRVESSADLDRGEVIRLADLSAATLPCFASTPYKDSRAPQNLVPIAGLERRLRSLLGDQRLLRRDLAAAALATSRMLATTQTLAAAQAVTP